MLFFNPIPTTLKALNDYSPHWLPFLPGIAKRSKEPVERLLEQVAKFDVQLAVVWDEDAKKALALVGIHYVKRGDDLIGEIVWLTGAGMRRWLHLLPQMEKYLHDMGCVEIRPICRPGWARVIKGQGYRTTHYMLEKKL